MSKRNDLNGVKFGRLTVIREVGKTNDRHILWLCKCDCGNNSIVSSRNLVSGHTISCGCYQKEATSKAKKKHGEKGTRLYTVWVGMRQRCNNKKSKDYKYYGGKGVSVCDNWDSFSNFKKWADASGYDELSKRGDCTIDRINPCGDYSPDNCRWVDMAEQNRNKRKKMDEEV